METIMLTVEGMMCQHCVKSITNALSVIDGISNVEVNLESKTVAITHNGTISIEVIKTEIEDLGYDVLS